MHRLPLPGTWRVCKRDKKKPIEGSRKEDWRI